MNTTPQSDFPAFDHWLPTVIGKPWRAGEVGPDAFDCWGLVVDYYKRVRGVTLDAVINFDPKQILACCRFGAKETQASAWHRVSRPTTGDVVAMGRNTASHHAGLWVGLDGGLILHAADGSRVVAHSKFQLAGLGINIHGFYRHGDSLH